MHPKEVSNVLQFYWLAMSDFTGLASFSGGFTLCALNHHTFSPIFVGSIHTNPTCRTGYYYFEECGEHWINPTIGMEVGEVYTFIQKDRTNFWHPLDFSYFPDATHVGADLLDPRIDKTTATGGAASSTSTSEASIATETKSCAHSMTCPAPMYYLNEGYLGTYSNLEDDETAPITVNQYDTGLELYEKFFFTHMAPWTGYGTFSIKLRFDQESYTDGDIFYYCRIHQFMAGRIKLLKNGQPIHEPDDPAMYFEMETPGEFDEMCGVSQAWWVLKRAVLYVQ